MAPDTPDAETFRRVRELFEQVVDLPAAERATVLDRECDGDPTLRGDVEELLACDEERTDLASLLERGAELFVPPSEVGVGARIGAFELQRVLGSGGMGTVYEAEQDRPRRKVALKVLSLALANEQAVRRFQWEAEVLANLRHPGIAQVHAVGVQQAGDIELPWFAMELVPGARDLIHYSKHFELHQKERIELFLQVCDAVHHGHLQGVVHRDLKPQNVLVDEEGRARVIDFGIARSMAGDANLTEGGIVLGTLHYMSPEQLRGRLVDLRSDIYSLGVVLFELLAGRRPFVFDETTPLVVAETVENQDAPRLSTVLRGADRDLEVVLQKALRREPGDRYGSVAEFAEDLRAFLEARPVRARAPSTFYQMRMFARRRRGLVSALAVILVLLVSGLVVVLSQNAELEAGQQVLREQNAELERRGRVSRRLAAFARDFLDNASFDSGRGIDYTVREALDVAARDIENETFEDAETEAELRELIGSTYRGLSLPDVAILHLRRAVVLFQQVGGPKSRRAVDSMTSLTVALREQGLVDEAREVAEQAVAVVAGEGCEDDPLWWTVQHNRAYVMRHRGELRAAHDLYAEVLAARERLLGESAYNTLATMHNYGIAKLGLRDAEGAAEVLTEAARRARASDHPLSSTLQIEDNLAEAWRDLGELDKAAAKHRETMRGYGELYGKDHHVTIGCGFHLLKVLYRQRRFDEQHELATDLLDRCVRTFGENDYRTMDVLQALAAAKNQLGDVDGAATLMTRAFDAVSSDRGELHPATFNAGHNLAMARIAAKDAEGADRITAEMIRRLGDADEQQLPPPFPGLTWLLRARALDAVGQEANAGKAAARAVEAFAGKVPDANPYVIEARERANQK